MVTTLFLQFRLVVVVVGAMHAGAGLPLSFLFTVVTVVRVPPLVRPS